MRMKAQAGGNVGNRTGSPAQQIEDIVTSRTGTVRVGGMWIRKDHLRRWVQLSGDLYEPAAGNGHRIAFRGWAENRVDLHLVGGDRPYAITERLDARLYGGHAAEEEQFEPVLAAKQPSEFPQTFQHLIELDLRMRPVHT